MTEQAAPPRVPTIAKPASAYVSSGVAVSVLALAVLLAAGYFGITSPATEFDAGPSVPLAWAGWALLAAGVTFLWVGVMRLVQHADRSAGVTYPTGQVAASED